MLPARMIKRAFPILAISIFCCMLGSGIVVPLLPLYAESLGATGFGLGATGLTLITAFFMRKIPVAGSGSEFQTPVEALGLALNIPTLIIAVIAGLIVHERVSSALRQPD